MTFLTLHSNMKSFSKENKTVCWSFPNLEFKADGQIGLKEIVIDLDSKNQPSYTLISCNLIEKNVNNMDGIIYCSTPIETHQDSSAAINTHRVVKQTYPAPAFWEIDVIRPRVIELTLSNVNTENINFISIVLEVRHGENRSL